MLWIQVHAFLRHSTAAESVIKAIQTQLFNPRHLHSVWISAYDGGARVHYWVLSIDWSRHTALLRTHPSVARRDFTVAQEALGVAEIVQMIEEYFALTGHKRGWGFESSLTFDEACSSIGVEPGTTVKDHPKLRKLGGLHLPGLSELSVEVYGIDE